MNTPLRTLQGVSYWVIEDPKSISGYVNTNVKREWEMDIREARGTIDDDPWLQSLSTRRWTLRVVDMNEIHLDPRIMNYRNDARNHDFPAKLAKRRAELRRSMAYGSVIWPVIVDEAMILRDGYCRYTALAEMGVTETYCYASTVQTRTE